MCANVSITINLNLGIYNLKNCIVGTFQPMFTIIIRGWLHTRMPRPALEEFRGVHNAKFATYKWAT